jgi:hypothetical protein
VTACVSVGVGHLLYSLERFMNSDIPYMVFQPADTEIGSPNQTNWPETYYMSF